MGQPKDNEQPNAALGFGGAMAYRSRRETSTVTLPDRVRSDGRIVAPDPEERLRARVGKNSAYDKYKEQLNQLFDGKRELPKQFKDMLAGAPGAEDHGFDAPEAEAAAPKKTKSRRGKTPAEQKGPRRRVSKAGDARAALLKEVRASNSPREIERSIDALRAAGFPLPDEFDVLSKALGHSSEEIQAHALSGLLKSLNDGAVKSPKLLKGRIENVALMATTSEVRDLCAELQAALSA